MTLFLELASFLKDAGLADPSLEHRASSLRVELSLVEALARELRSDPAQDRSASGRGSRPSSAGAGAAPLAWSQARVVCDCGAVFALEEALELPHFVVCPSCRRENKLRVENLRRRVELGERRTLSPRGRCSVKLPPNLAWAQARHGQTASAHVIRLDGPFAHRSLCGKPRVDEWDRTPEPDSIGLDPCKLCARHAANEIARLSTRGGVA